MSDTSKSWILIPIRISVRQARSGEEGTVGKKGLGVQS